MARQSILITMDIESLTQIDIASKMVDKNRSRFLEEYGLVAAKSIIDKYSKNHQTLKSVDNEITEKTNNEQIIMENVN
jgi:hypothetical protein